MRLGPRGQLGCGTVMILLSGLGLVLWFGGETRAIFNDASPAVNLMVLVGVLLTGCLVIWHSVSSVRKRKQEIPRVDLDQLDEATRRKLEQMVYRPPQRKDAPDTPMGDLTSGDPQQREE